MPVLTRLYQPDAGEAFGPAQGTAGFRDWLQAAAQDLLVALSRPRDTLPKLTLAIGDYVLAPEGAPPRRATAAVLAGVFCIAPDPNMAVSLTFLDPRGAADMMPGSSASRDPAPVMRLPANGLVLFPGWVPQGHSAAPAEARPRWLKLRFRPMAFAARPLD